jgi:hypothetical protein
MAAMNAFPLQRLIVAVTLIFASAFTVDLALSSVSAQVIGATATFNRTYYVNSATDNSSVADCASSLNTDCGIDDAIAAFDADTTPNDDDEIVFASSIPVFTVSTPTTIDNPTTGIALTMQGHGQSATAVSGGARHTVLTLADVGAGSDAVDISGLTIEDGNPTVSGDGGGIYDFGDDGTTLTVTDSTISGNTGNADGGGITTYGATTLTDDTISGNTAGSGGGGIYDQSAPLRVTDSTISGNSADAFGGIWNNEGTLTITGSTISGNTASDGDGGGINNGGSATITDSTITGNTASGTDLGDIGGFWNNGTATLTGDTISGNTANGKEGGGIWNNDALTVGATIVADNTGGDCHYGGGTVTESYDIDDDGSCGFISANHIISV